MLSPSPRCAGERKKNCKRKSGCEWDKPNKACISSGSSDSSSDSSSSDSSDDHPELTFLEQVKYPYDAWLPEESDDPAERLKIPSLSLPFYNRVLDVRATISAKATELIVSTAGNWQFALRKLLKVKFFEDNPSVKESYLITTSPPISVAQMKTGRVKVGNILYKNAEPHVAIGPQPLMNGLKANGPAPNGFILDGFTPFQFYENYGNVILRLKGNTKFSTFTDLAKIEPGRFASATVGAVNNYRNSIRDIFDRNEELVQHLVEEGFVNGTALVNRLFDEAGVAAIGPPMHQSIPHVLVRGEGDAGLMLLELAVGIMRNNPGVFESCYLAKDKTGCTDDPEILKHGQDPLDGNVVVTILATKTTTAVNTEQQAARDNFIKELKSEKLTEILAESGLRRPAEFVEL